MALGLPCSCGHVLVATSAMSGTRTPCPNCGKTISVPSLGSQRRSPSTLDNDDAYEEESGVSTVAVWAGIAGGGVVLLGLLVWLLVLCFSGGNREDGDLLAQGLPPPDDKPPAPLVKPAPDAGKPKEKESIIAPPPIQPIIPPSDKAKDPQPAFPGVKETPPRTTLPPTDPPKQVKPFQPPVNPPKKTAKPSAPPIKEEKGLIVPLITTDFADAKLPYKVRHLQLPQNFKPKTLRLAVTPPNFDDMGRLLDDLGDGFRYQNITNDDLGSVDRLRNFDVVFLTCGGGHPFNAPQALRKFVEGGGTLYASDLRYDLVLEAFPDMRPTIQVPDGAGMQNVKAEIVDNGLRHYLGRPSLILHFDSDGWKPAIFDKKKSKSFMEGYYRPDEFSNPINARLLVRFRSGQGTVIFTSFHNATQNNEIERRLLKYLVFQAVSAKSETRIHDLMVEAGFAAPDLKNVQLAKAKSTAPLLVSHKGGRLQFALGYDALGAKLRLNLTAPDGQKIEHEDDAMFLLEIPNAPQGTWTYSVTALSTPFANFPFVLAVGRGK